MTRKNLPMVRVLIIEDSDMQIALIQEMLQKAKNVDFEAIVEMNLEGGLSRLNNEPFDAVLLDLTLPDSTGMETCEKVCSAAPTVPVVVLTGADDEETALSAQQHGAADYLLKGEVSSDLLARCIRYSITRKKAQLELQAANDELEQRVEERTAELRKAQADVAQRQEDLAHAARLNSLGEMASGLAHELNQPLMAIIGFTDHCLSLIETGSDNPERMTEILGDTSRQAKRAGTIIKRMRRLVSKRASSTEPADLNQVVEESVQILSPGLELKIDLDLQAEPSEVLIDRVQIQQVILNLAQNAVQAMEHDCDKDCQLIIRSGNLDNEFVFVEVVDNGPGIAPEHLERLFEPFFTRNKPDGLGLGLSITQNIVDTHGGELSAKHNEYSGLTLRFTLPMASVAQPS